MKQLFFAMLMLAGTSAMAKDIRTLVVTTQPQMHCSNCEQKIKNNLRFEKGVKRIETDIPQQRVTITYDADKTTPEALLRGFQKIKYTAQPVEPKSTKEKK